MLHIKCIDLRYIITTLLRAVILLHVCVIKTAVVGRGDSATSAVVGGEEEGSDDGKRRRATSRRTRIAVFFYCLIGTGARLHLLDKGIS